MTYGTSRIRNLSIALEVVSHLNGCRSEYDRIRDLLSEAIDAERKEQEYQKSIQTATIYSSTTDTDEDPSF